MAVDTSSSEQSSLGVRRRRDWREGGRTVKPWDETVLAIALVALGLALVVAAVIRGFDPGAAASTAASAVLLVGMLVGVVIAFLRAKPRPLLRLRTVDLLYGLMFGVVLRLVQGWFEVAAGGSGALPTFDAGTGGMGDVWVFADVASLLVVAPVVEELFFRGVLFVTAYSVVRRMAGRIPAIVTALVLSFAAFTATHAWNAGVSWEAWATPLAVGLVCATLVLATGRIWGAVFVHLVFNASYVVLMFVAALLG